MPVDPNLSLATQQPDTATPIRQAQQDDNANALNAEQVLKTHLDNLNEREKQRLQSTVVGAAQLKTYLDKGDIEGAHTFLVNRQASLHQRMASGENVDDQETAYAIDKIRKGDIEGLKNDVSSIVAAGQAYNMIGRGDDTPSSVKEWQYYNSLSPEDQNRWLINKRASQVVDLGDHKTVLNPTNPGGPPVADLPVNLKPEDQPINAQNKAEATARGTTAGTNAANAAASAEGLKAVSAALLDLQVAGKSAPGGVAQNLGASVANKSGYGGAQADAQGAFIVKRAAAENAIREAFRVAGSGSQSDADAKPFIDMLPVADDSDSVKVSKTNAAMKAVENRINSKLKLAAGAGAPPPMGSQAPTTVVISNGKETYSVSPEDAALAEKEGFKRVQ